jgi:hypothetical protein
MSIRPSFLAIRVFGDQVRVAAAIRKRGGQAMYCHRDMARLCEVAATVQMVVGSLGAVGSKKNRYGTVKKSIHYGESSGTLAKAGDPEVPQAGSLRHPC